MTHCPACQALLPDPRERFCPQCGQDLETAALLPAIPPAPLAIPPPPPTWNPPPGGAGGGWQTPPAAGRGTPWERRGEIGTATALVETTQAVLLRPSEFYREMPVVGGLVAPLAYGLVLGYIGVVSRAIYDLVFSSVLGSAVSGLSVDPQLQPFLKLLEGGGGVLGFVMALVLGIPMMALGMFLMSGVLHLFLMMLGGASRGFEATFRVVAYSQATALLNVIPVCGSLLAGLYALVLLVIGLKEAQQISASKALMAVLLPIVLVCCCCGGVLALAFGSIASMIGNAR